MSGELEVRIRSAEELADHWKEEFRAFQDEKGLDSSMTSQFRNISSTLLNKAVLSLESFGIDRQLEDLEDAERYLTLIQTYFQLLRDNPHFYEAETRPIPSQEYTKPGGSYPDILRGMKEGSGIDYVAYVEECARRLGNGV